MDLFYSYRRKDIRRNMCSSREHPIENPLSSRFPYQRWLESFNKDWNSASYYQRMAKLRGARDMREIGIVFWLEDFLDECALSERLALASRSSPFID